MRTFATASVHVVTLLLLTAGGCKKSTSAEAPPAGSGASAAATSGKLTPPDPAKVTMAACKDDMDCPHLPHLDFDSSCSFKCQKPTFDAPAGYCQLQTLVAAVGAGPCTAGHVGVTTSGGGWTETKHPFTYACDINAGVYCDAKTSACAAVKGVGADCNPSETDSPNDGVCGKDGVCDSASKKCVAATAVGASCKDVHCGADAFCDYHSYLCVARKADGEAIKGSDECASLRWDGQKCNPTKAPTPCAL